MESLYCREAALFILVVTFKYEGNVTEYLFSILTSFVFEKSHDSNRTIDSIILVNFVMFFCLYLILRFPKYGLNV